MQGLWQRRKVNLNAAPTVPSTSATTSTPTTPPGPPTSTPSDEPPRLEPAASGNAEEVPSTTTASSSKRKLRSTREEGGKRSRIGAKEHTPPTVRLSDLGGVNPCVEKMLELVAMPLAHPEVYLHTGVQPPRGVLLHGPPGCGKTMLANAIGGVRMFLFFRVVFARATWTERCPFRNWACLSFRFRPRRSCPGCLASRKKRCAKLSRRPKCVWLRSCG
jgi:ribosome biogenesis ATPase